MVDSWGSRKCLEMMPNWVSHSSRRKSEQPQVLQPASHPPSPHANVCLGQLHPQEVDLDCFLVPKMGGLQPHYSEKQQSCSLSPSRAPGPAFPEASPTTVKRQPWLSAVWRSS